VLGGEGGADNRADGLPPTRSPLDAPVKVAFVSTLYPTGREVAHGTFIRDQARALSAAGCELAVLHINLRSPRGIGRGHPAPPETEPAGPQAPAVLRWNGWSAGPRSVPLLARRGARALLDWYLPTHGTPDIVHGHFCFGAGEAAASIARATGAHLVITEHSTEFARGRAIGWRRAAVRRAASAADALVAVSDDLAVRLEEVVGRHPVVIPNVIDVDAFPPRRAGPASGQPHIVSVGSLTKKKGYDLLLRSLALLPQDDWRATIAGEGPERGDLSALAEELQIAGRLSLPGVLDRTGIVALMSDASVFVSSSRHETFGVAVAEALSIGVPVVTTRSGGPESLIGPFGVVVDAEPTSIAGGVRAVLEGGFIFDPQESHDRIRATFGPAVIAETIFEVYAGLEGR
jgi:glycosyltransferase involved in cell wall biosynthesis